MKADCNINMKELTGIVDGMLAEKNQLGREAFKHMAEELTPKPENPIKEWTNSNMDFESAFEDLYDAVDSLTSQLEDIARYGDESEGSKQRVYAITGTAKEYRQILEKISKEYGV